MAAFWPEPVEYAEAVQTPRTSFSDADLQSASAEMGMLGPVMYSGGFASVYHLTAADGQRSWAVKCFTKQVVGQRERYRQISEHLHAANLGCAVDFQYQEKGIRIRNVWFPILKMDWVNGLTLLDFVEQNIEDYRYLGRLYTIWLRLEPYLRESQTVHGDLQHGNVMLVPGQNQGKLSLRVIDYDGLWTPELASSPSGEAGHKHYQHPDRQSRQIYSPEVDRFPNLVIAAALRCLSRPNQTDLWRRYQNGDNLLFTKGDFENPESSALLHDLWTSRIPELQWWAGLIAVAAKSPLDATPRLQERLIDGKLPAIPAEEMSQAREILGPQPAAGFSETGSTPVAVVASEVLVDELPEIPVEVPFTEQPVIRTQSPATDRATSNEDRPATVVDDSGRNFDRLFLMLGGALIAVVLLIAVPLVIWSGRKSESVATPIQTEPIGERSDVLSKAVSENTVKSSSKDPPQGETQLSNVGTNPHELLTLNAHTGRVWSVAYSPDGKRLASAGDDYIVRVWEAANGRETLTLKGHTGEVHGVAYSPDGQRLASASVDWTVRIWDARTGQELLKLLKGSPTDDNRSLAWSVTFSPDGKRLAAAIGDFARPGMVKVWDAASGEETLTFNGHNAQVRSVAYSPDGLRLASASIEGVVKVWDAATGQELLTLKGGQGWDKSIAFSPDGKRLASVGYQTVHVFDATSGEETLTLKGHTSPVNGVAFSPDGKRLASAGSHLDETVRVWDATSGQETLTLKGHTGYVVSVAFSPDGKQLASSSFDQTVRVWDVEPTAADSKSSQSMLPNVGNPAATDATGSGTESSSAAPPLAIAPFDADEAKKHQAAWAKHLGSPVTIKNSIGMTLVCIPAGTFTMGSPARERDRDQNEGPQHTVRISRPFYMGGHEVTQGQYQRVMGTNPSRFSKSGQDSSKVSQQDTTRFPVESVSWDDAQDFCRRLSELPQERDAGRTYRLPAEAEWEYACRAGTTTPFHFGDIANGRQANINGSEPYGTRTPGLFLDRTQKIGSSRANAFGLGDMHGNVSEWCEDRFDESAYWQRRSGTTTDPTVMSGSANRVLRGGSWYKVARIARSANRFNQFPDVRYNDVGFRVVLASTTNLTGDTAAPVASRSSVDTSTQPQSGSESPLKAGSAEVVTSLSILKRKKSTQVRSVAISPKDGVLAAGYMDGYLTAWDLATGTERKEFKAQSSGVTEMAYSPDGRTVVTQDGSDVLLWDAKTWKQTGKIPVGRDQSIAFAPDGTLLSASNSSKTISVWNVTTSRLVRSIETNAGSAREVAFSSNGKTLAARYTDGAIILRDVQTGKEQSSLAGLPGLWNTLLALSADGTTLASYCRGAGGKPLILWDLASRNERVSIPQGNSFDSLAFSPDGKLLATGCSDNKVRVWDSQTGASQAEFSGHSDSIVALAFTNDGQTLVSGSLDTTIQTWKISTQGLFKGPAGTTRNRPLR